MDRTFSEHWFRVEGLRPRLKPHIRMVVQRRRGQRWYALKDDMSGKTFRLSPETFQLVRHFNGHRTIGQIWQDSGGCMKDGQMIGQDEVIRLLGQMNQADLLAFDAAGDPAERLQRRRRTKRIKWLSHLANPLALRMPLFNPDRILGRLFLVMQPMLGWTGLLVWAVICLWLVIMVGVHWDELSHGIVDRVLSSQNLALMAISYPFLKVVHELGHGLLVKKWGGNVRVFGIMFLVLMPVPYVDASSANLFRFAHQRIAVAAGGVMAELLVASFAMWLWLLAEPGLLHAWAYVTMLLVLVSSLMFNLNPLMRFDAYYALTDLLGMPNLAQSANGYVGYLFKRHVLGFNGVRNPVSTRGEARWLLGYALAAFAYRVFLTWVLVLLLVGKYFVFGLMLSVWLIAAMWGLPLWRSLRSLWQLPEMERERGRIFLYGAGLAVVSYLLLFVVPFPNWMMTEGIVWMPENARIVSGSDGFVEEVRVHSGEGVHAGEVILQLANPELRARKAILKAELAKARLERDRHLLRDRIEYDKANKRMLRIQRELKDVQRRIDTLTLRSPVSGQVFFGLPESDLPGRYLAKGAVAGYVVGDKAHPVIRAVVMHDRISDVKKAIGARGRRFGDMRARDVRILRVMPGATRELPSPALALDGGGTIPVRMLDAHKLEAIEPVFQLETSLPRDGHQLRIGERFYLRLRLPTSPLAPRLIRFVRQKFLGRLHA